LDIFSTFKNIFEVKQIRDIRSIRFCKNKNIPIIHTYNSILRYFKINKYIVTILILATTSFRKTYRYCKENSQFLFLFFPLCHFLYQIIDGVVVNEWLKIDWKVEQIYLFVVDIFYSDRIILGLFRQVEAFWSTPVMIVLLTWHTYNFLLIIIIHVNGDLSTHYIILRYCF
jgi:hypothetical protein